MGIADRLFSEAQEISQNLEYGAAQIEREVFDLETQLEQKKSALHTARMASKRASNFRPVSGMDFHCPACWIEKEEIATLRPIPDDCMRCNVCDRAFQV